MLNAMWRLQNHILVYCATTYRCINVIDTSSYNRPRLYVSLPPNNILMYDDTSIALISVDVISNTRRFKDFFFKYTITKRHLIITAFFCSLIV